jgi:two-component system, NarL family, response regulator DegU
MKDKINVCVVDDHNLFRKAIVNLIRGFSRIGEITDAENGKDFVERFKMRIPHVLLLDLEMPFMNGVETAEFLIPRYPGLKIIVLTQHDSESYMVHMLELGVHSFLLKNSDPLELERAIHGVMDKDFYHSDLVAQVIRKSIMGKYKSERPQFASWISDREREIIKCICKEMTYKEIGQQLALSEFTVRNHHFKLMERLGIKKTIGLVRFAYERGLID